jgi:hypothetical protein
LEIELSRGDGWDPVIKRGGLEIELSRGDGWDPVIKRRGLEIELSRGDGWDPVIKRGGLGPLTCLTLPHLKSHLSELKSGK